MIAAIAASAVAFFTVYLAMPPLIRILEARNMTVPDVNKKGHVMVARPGGPALIAGILASEAVMYAFFPDGAILAIMATTTIAFFVGLTDDIRVIRGVCISAGIRRPSSPGLHAATQKSWSFVGCPPPGGQAT
jgi:UDP-N-acetylglucosamine--dolichyl-phosphate N-acetylglucosaminephosphotransferase